MKIFTAVILVLLIFIGRTSHAEDLFLEGDFSVTLAGGSAYSGSFRGTIPNAVTDGTALFHSDDFSFFEAELSPPLIGETLFDDTNLKILVYYRNGVFEQLWFGGEDHGPNGTREGNDGVCESIIRG